MEMENVRVQKNLLLWHTFDRASSKDLIGWKETSQLCLSLSFSLATTLIGMGVFYYIKLMSWSVLVAFYQTTCERHKCPRFHSSETEAHLLLHLTCGQIEVGTRNMSQDLAYDHLDFWFSVLAIDLKLFALNVHSAAALGCSSIRWREVSEEVEQMKLIFAISVQFLFFFLFFFYLWSDPTIQWSTIFTVTFRTPSILRCVMCLPLAYHRHSRPTKWIEMPIADWVTKKHVRWVFSS